MSSNKSADRTITTHVIWAMGAGLIPLPLVDLAAVTAVQVDMLHQLSRDYGQQVPRDKLRTFVSAVAGSTLARLGASLVKTIPGIGSLFGGLSMSVLSGASTYAVGEVARQQLENPDGSGFTGFDINAAKERYDAEFERGKEFAQNLREKEGQSRDAFDSLRKLGELRDAGVVTEDEFEAKKKQLLESISI